MKNVLFSNKACDSVFLRLRVQLPTVNAHILCTELQLKSCNTKIGQTAKNKRMGGGPPQYQMLMWQKLDLSLLSYHCSFPFGIN